MKQINILKKAAGTISILLLLLSLAACGNMLEERKGNTVVEPVENTGAGILVRGEIKVQGAVPSRAATSCFDGAFSWKIFAQNQDLIDSVGEPDADLTNIFAESFTTTNEFTLTLPIAGNWSISASGYAGTFTKETLPSSSEVFSGSDTYTITKEGSNRAIIIHPVVWGDSLFPAQGANPLKGSINLPITSNAENVYQVSAKLVKKVTRTVTGTGTDADAETVEEVVEIPPKTFTAGSSSLEASDVPAGFYTAKIIFEDSIGNILYSCHEGISVYPGLTTDTWFGTAPYFSIDDEGTHFVVTNDLINSYDSERVINTDYVLYSGNTIYKGSSLTDIGNEEYIQQQEYCTRIKSDFDSEGNVYTLIKKYESNGGYYYGLSLYRNNDTANPLLDTELSTSGFYFKCFCIDRKTDTFYFSRIIRENYGDQSYVLYKCPKSALSSFIDSIDNYDFTISDISDSVIANNKFTVYEDVMYIASGNTLKAINVSDIPDSSNSTPELSDSEVQTYSYVDGTFSTVTDILYQDKAVYILNQYSEGNTNMNQEKKGLTLKRQSSLVKFSTLLKTFTTLGWNNSPLDTEGKWLYTYGMDSYNILDYQYFTDAACSSHVLIKADDIVTSELKLYFTASDGNKLSTTGFYGPQAFVAIKPKQLVIADDGLAIYTDAYGLFRGKNVNRVVFVDLENFAISDTKELTNTITFGGEQTGLPLSLCTFAWGPENLYNENHELFYDKEATPADTTIYYKDNNEKKSKSLSFGSLIVGIPVDSE